MRNFYPLLFSFIFLFAGTRIQAQAPTCDPSVPFYQVNLTGNPAGTWVSPVHSRNGNCCSTTSPDRCTSFEILVDTGAAMISFEIASGAIPPGSMFYQIGCGPQVAVGQPICITGPGPHFLTFCKPGNNTNTYRVTSIPKPTFPKNDTARIGCSLPLRVLGMVETSVTWNSIFPGAPGAYNTYLNCTSGCDTVIYTPASNAPAFVDYLICGTPIATQCGYVAVCDTVRIYNFNALTGSVTPDPATFCQGGPGVTVTGSASGGQSPYSFTWYDQSLQIVGSTASYNATTGGNYQLEIRDYLYDPQYCPSVFVNVPVTATLPPVVNAGADQTVCRNNPIIVLNGTVQHASGGIWTGGAGTFSPSATSLVCSYTPTAGELAAGQVTLTLTSTGAGGGCTNASDAVTIFFPPLLSVNVADVNTLCNGSNGTLTAAVSGGSGPYAYQWTNGASTSSITTGAGTFCATVTDNIGCTASDCGTISTPAALAVTMSSTACTTNGGNNGTASASVSGGTAPYTYLWSNNATTSSISGLSYGIYTVTVTDANGCQIQSSIVVNEPRCNNYQVSSGGSNVLCNGAETGTATATVINGTPNYTYLWSDPLHQTTSTAVNLSAGVYQCIVTDANNCSAVVNVTITQPTALVNTMTHTNVSVIGGNDGSAQANVSGGTPVYSYLWSNSGTGSSISSLTAGIYSVTVTDANNCTLMDSVQVTQPPCNNLVLSVVTSPATCSGNNNGSASAVVLFGNNPINYLWSTGSTASSISNLSPGSYSLTISDALNCSSFVNFTITAPSPLSLGLSPTDVRCSESLDGTIELTVSGGTYPYSYTWSNGSAVEDLIYLTDGTYSVTVTDANGCTVSGSTVIDRPDPISVSSVNTNITCFGGSNGAIDASVSGGISPYTYSWSNGATTQDISGLSADSYILTVTDANGCVNGTPFNVSMNEPGQVMIDSVLVACPVPGSGLSQITVYPSGGNNGAYQVSFDGGTNFLGSGVYIVNMPVDSTYIIALRDTFGCPSAANDTVTVNAEVNILAASFNPCIADGVNSIPVSVNVSGGSQGLYMISFDNGNTFLPAGTYSTQLATGNSYTIIAKDSLACISTSETISIPDEIVLGGTTSSYAGGYQVSCVGASDGSVDLSASGGSGTYSYAWSNSSTTQDLVNLSAGTYSVIVTDSLSCTDTIAFTLTEPSQLTASAVATSNFNGYNVSCAGSTNGSADLTVNGGTPGYTFSWSNAASTEDLSNIGAGTYTVTVTDANGCLQTASVTLTEPALLDISASHIDVPCNGFSTGSIDITMTGGVQPMSYLWSNSATTEDLTALPAGTYSVNVTDANGCQADTSIVITENLPVVSTIQFINPLCAGDANGTVDLSVAGGTAPYTYTWSNGQTSEDLGGLPGGVYNILIQDANGCLGYNTVTLANPPALNSNISSPVQVNGHNISFFGGSDGSINLDVSGGTPAYQYQWSNGSTNEDQNGLGAGTYTVTITDANGCTILDTIVLDQPFDLAMPTGYSPNSDGFNDAFVIHGIEAYPENRLEVYNRWGNLVYASDNYMNMWRGTSDTGDTLPDGTYFVVLNINKGEIVLTGYVDVRR